MAAIGEQQIWLYTTPWLWTSTGLQGEQEREQAVAQPSLPRAPHQAHPVCAERDLRGCSFTLNEWHARALLKISKDRQVLKFIKKRVRTHIRTKKTKEELSYVLLVKKD